MLSSKYCRFDYEPTLRSFYKASNYIPKSLVGPNTKVLMHLIYTNCVSIIMWGFEVKEFLYRELKQLKTAINGAIRKIFACPWIEVPQHRTDHGYSSLEDLIDKAKARFKRSLATSSNPTLRALYNLFN